MTDIKVTTHTTFKDFLQVVSEPLYAREWQNAIPLGIYPQYLTQKPPPRLIPGTKAEVEAMPTLLSTASPAGDTTLVVTKTPSYGAMSIYSAIDPAAIPGLHAHINALATVICVDTPADAIPACFNGDERLSRPLAVAVARRLGRDQKCITTNAHYIGAVLTSKSLSPLIPRGPLPAGHVVRRVTTKDHRAIAIRALLVEMYVEMFREARGAEVAVAAAQEVVDGSVAVGHVWAYFLAGEPVSAAFVGRPTKGGKSVQVVYTRAEFRGRGCAQALMDTLSATLLREGVGYLMLFFEPGGVAERIYRKVGFGEEGTYVSVDLGLDSVK